MKKLKILMLFSVVLVSCFGCAAKLTKEKYDRINIGMGYRDVASILGGEGACDEDMAAKDCTWGNAEKNIKVKFIADKAVSKDSKGI